jgi:aminopeptidase N
MRTLCLVALFLASLQAHAQQTLHHALELVLDPMENSIAVQNTLTLPGSAQQYEFRLNANLTLHTLQGENFTIELLDAPGSGSEADAGREIAPSKHYRLTLAANQRQVSLFYSGTINADTRQASGEYAQSFSSTTGIIGPQGVYLDHSSIWVPDFQSGLMRFEMSVAFAESAESWSVISQGDSLGRENYWRSEEAMEEIYLVAADFTTYRVDSGGIEMLAYLRQPDSNLATRYLDATERYLALYEPMLGDYPFSKFALVENFWETGYGMPSFTLLGPQVIRFPFILDTSYPHEILHNWWGNSVYPDYETGNWSEGLTAYLADHLFQEMNAAGAEYRKDMLGRYRSFVSDEADFPLNRFTSRNSAASQAIGYGKTLMLWHMLRIELGDELFLRSLRDLYTERRFQRTSFADIEVLFSRNSGRDLSRFFAQWVDRTGAPALAVEVNARPDGTADILVRQLQQEPSYELIAPIALYYDKQTEAQIVELTINQTETSLNVPDYASLQAVLLDPYFDVFRRLDVTEMPPTIRQMFGSREIMFVIPPENRHLWIEMAEFFTGDPAINAEIVMQEDFQLLPSNKSVWIMGRDNPATRIIAEAVEVFGVRISDAGLSLQGSELLHSNRSTVLTATHPDDPELSIGWIHADSEAAMPGLTEKLPHYGRYSYLSFIGNEPTNDVKGQWENPESPLLWRKPGLSANVQLALLPARTPLAELPPKYLPEGLVSHVNALTSPAMEGRGAGTEGLHQAAEYIAAQFADIGLDAPGGTHLQTWAATLPDQSQVQLSNVIGILPGSDDSLRGAPVIVGAHYDHLGFDHDGSLFPGADDNASGIAILVEVARKLQRAFTPRRPIVFVAFSGEESGLLGSRHFVANPPAPYRTEDLFAMINLDSVGRLEGRSLQVFATDSAYEWPFMAQGIGFTIGVESEFPAQSVAGSDHVSFLEAGIPAIHLFSGLHNDYHRSSDSVDKLDLAGMSAIALWLEEAVVYLSGRDQALRVNLANAPQRAPAAVAGARSASLGTIPEFNYAGSGVQISGVTPGGAGAQAGLQAGDILLRYNDVELTDLQQYSSLLRESAPGDAIRIQIRRGDQVLDIDVVLQAR